MVILAVRKKAPKKKTGRGYKWIRNPRNKLWVKVSTSKTTKRKRMKKGRKGRKR